jgi:hypothetical protein
MPLNLILFVFLGCIALIAWFKGRKVSLYLFAIFLILYALTFYHHMTDKLPISL